MKCKMIFMAAGMALLLSACNEQNAETKAESQPATSVEAKTVSAAPTESAPAPKPASAALAAKISMVDWNAAYEMAKNGAIFVDVRNPNELREGFVQGSINIPLSELKQRFTELPKGNEYLVYCRSGRRSEVATNFLMQQGYEKVHNVLGGMMANPQR